MTRVNRRPPSPAVRENEPGRFATWRWKVVLSLILIGLVWAVFGQTLGFQFVNYDDPSYILENRYVASGLSWPNVKWAFTHIHSQNWHPLTSIAHMLDVTLFGLTPGPYHAVNVFWHGLTAVLLFLFLARTTGSIWTGAFAAAVFAIHPLRVESVAWISERKDVLSGFFFALTLWLYARYVERPGAGRYVLVAIALACGLMSKPMLVTVPVVLLLLDYWPLARFRREVHPPSPRLRRDSSAGEEGRGRTSKLRGQGLAGLFIEKIPLFALVAGSIVATFWAQNFALGATDQLPIKWRLTNALVSYCDYIRQTFWPNDLIPFYVHHEGRLETWQIALAAAVLAGITLAAWIWRKRHKYYLVGWLWYVVMLTPVIGLVQVGLQGKADRYTYLPQIGLIIAVAWLIRDFSASWPKRSPVLGPLAAIVIAALSVLSWKQTKHWHDTETLWRYTLTITPDSDVAHTGLAGILYVRGQLDDAIAHYREAIARRSGNAAAQNGLARALADQNKVDEAAEHWEKAVELQPDNATASNSLALMYVRRGEMAAAKKQWENTLEFDPENFDAANNLSWFLSTAADATLRNPAKALELAQRATALAQERSPVVYRTLAEAFAENHRFDEAIAAAQRGIQLAESLRSPSVATELQECIGAFREGKTWRDLRGIP